MLGAILKTLYLAWPFIKEMVIKNTSIKEAIQANRMVTFLFIGFAIATLMCYYMGNMVVRQYNVAELLRQRTDGYEVQLTERNVRVSEAELHNLTLENDKELLRQAITWYRGELEAAKLNMATLRERNDERAAETIQQRETISNLREQITLMERKVNTPTTYARSRIQQRLDKLREQENSP